MRMRVTVMSEGLAAVVVCPPCPPTPPSISLGLTIRGGACLLVCLCIDTSSLPLSARVFPSASSPSSPPPPPSPPPVSSPIAPLHADALKPAVLAFRLSADDGAAPCRIPEASHKRALRSGARIQRRRGEAQVRFNHSLIVHSLVIEWSLCFVPVHVTSYSLPRPTCARIANVANTPTSPFT